MRITSRTQSLPARAAALIGAALIPLGIASCGANPGPAPIETTEAEAPSASTQQETPTPSLGEFTGSDAPRKPDSSDLARGWDRLRDAQEDPIGPGAAERLTALGLNPADWGNGSSSGLALNVDSLPWALPETGPTTIATSVPMSAETRTEWKKEKGEPPLWFRMEKAGLAPDITGVPTEASDGEPLGGLSGATRGGSYRLTACSPYTRMSDADAAKVRVMFGPTAVTVPASDWTSGGVGVVLPSSLEVRNLLPCEEIA